MNSFDTYLLRRIYKKIAKLGDKLAEADAQIDWTTFRPIIKDLYLNDTEKGGRPNVDEVVMVKLLVLQQCQGLMSWRGRLTTGSASSVSSVTRIRCLTAQQYGSSGNASPRRVGTWRFGMSCRGSSTRRGWGRVEKLRRTPP